MLNGKRGAGLYAASVGISAMVTAGFEPLEVLAGWIGAGLLRLILSNRKGVNKNKVKAMVTIGAGIPIISGLIWAAEMAFPQESTFPFVSLCILFLLYRVLMGEKRNPVITGNVLGLSILPLIGVIELFGAGNLEWKQMIPESVSMLHILITICAAAPWWVAGSRERQWGWFYTSGGMSLFMSILVAGTLGKGLRAHTGAPLYRAVQGIQILGKLQRFEALLAAAILMGIFTAVMLMGEKIREAAETVSVEGHERRWYVGILFLAFLTELLFRVLNTKNAPWFVGIYYGLVLVYGMRMAKSANVEINEKSA